MHSKGLQISVSLLISLLSTSVLALSVPNGWYVEANAGSTHLSGVSFPGNASTSGLGGSADVGYKFMPYFAAEIGYSRYKNTVIENALDQTVATIKHYSYDVAARGILPIGLTGVEVFGKVGAGRVASNADVKNQLAAINAHFSSQSHSQTGLYLGAGVQYYVTPELAGVLQWARAFGNSSTGTFDLFSVGVSFIAD